MHYKLLVGVVDSDTREIVWRHTRGQTDSAIARRYAPE